MIKKLGIILFIPMIYILSGCNILQQSNNKAAGLTGSFKLTSSDSRLIAHDDSSISTITEYQLTATGPDDASLNQTSENLIFSILDIAPGDWTFFVSAVNVNNTSIMQGSLTVTILAGENHSGEIEMNYFGNTDFTLNIDWYGELSSPSLSVFLTDEIYGGTPVELTMTITDDTATTTSMISSGLYSMRISLLDGTDVVGGYSNIVELVNGSMISSFPIQVSYDKDLKSGTIYYLDPSDTTDNISITLGGSTYSSIRSKGASLVPVEVDQSCSYYSTVVDGAKEVNFTSISSNSGSLALKPGTTVFSFTTDSSGTYSYLSEDESSTHTGTFNVYNTSVSEAELYLADKNVSMFDLQDNSTNPMHVIKLTFGNMDIYANPADEYSDLATSSPFSTTSETFTVEDLTTNGGLDTWNYRHFKISVPNHNNLVLEYVFYSRHKGVVRYSYFDGVTVTGSSPFSFSLASTFYDNGNGNRYYSWDYNTTQTFTEGILGNLYDFDYTRYDSTSDKLLRFTFNDSDSDNINDFSVESILEATPIVATPFKIDIIGADNYSYLMAVWYKEDSSTEFKELLNFSSTSTKTDPVYYIRYFHDDVAPFNDNKLVLYDSYASYFLDAGGVETVNALVVLDGLQDNIKSQFEIFQPANQFVALKSSSQLTDLYARFVFSPSELGYQDYFTDSQPDPEAESGWFGVMKSISSVTGTTADISYSYGGGETCLLRYTELNRGIFEYRDSSNNLIESGIFNSGVDINSEANPVYDASFVEDLDVTNLSDVDIVFTNSGEYRLIFDGDVFHIEFNEDGYETFISFNILGTIDNNVIINVNAASVSDATYRKQWYIYDSDNSMIYMGDDIIDYLENGFFETGYAFEAHTAVVIPQI